MKKILIALVTPLLVLAMCVIPANAATVYNVPYTFNGGSTATTTLHGPYYTQFRNNPNTSGCLTRCKIYVYVQATKCRVNKPGDDNNAVGAYVAGINKHANLTTTGTAYGFVTYDYDTLQLYYAGCTYHVQIFQ